MDSRRVAPAMLLAVALALKPDPSITVTVDVTALAGVLPRALRSMMREASALWRPEGVTLAWVLSPAARALPETRPTLDVVREAGVPNAPTGGAPRLGAAVFLDGSVDAERRLGLSVEAVGRLVDNTPWAGRHVAGWPSAVREELMGRALGRVLAHEIGHYVLAWRGHTPDGLMRAGFRLDQLIDPDRRPYAIPERLQPRLRGRLTRLSGQSSILAAVD